MQKMSDNAQANETWSAWQIDEWKYNLEYRGQ